MDEVAAPFEPTLIYSLRKTPYLNIDTWEGLPTWISEAAKRAICRSITNAIATNILHWTTPVLVATQLKMNLGSIHEVQTVFLRAMPRYQGIVAHDCIKVWLDEDNNEGATTKSVYFGNVCCFYKTQRANNSWSSNGFTDMKIMGLTKSRKYLRLNWPLRQTRTHTAPCL